MENKKISYTTLTIYIGLVFLVGVILYALFFHEGDNALDNGSNMSDAQVTLPAVGEATPDIKEVESPGAIQND